MATHCKRFPFHKNVAKKSVTQELAACIFPDLLQMPAELRCRALRCVTWWWRRRITASGLRCVVLRNPLRRLLTETTRYRRHNQEQRHTNLRLGDIINLVQFNTVISFTRHSRDALALFWNCREGYISCWSSEPYILMMLMMMMRQSLYHWSVAWCPSNWRCLDVGEVNEPCTNVLCAALMFHQPSSG